MQPPASTAKSMVKSTAKGPSGGAIPSPVFLMALTIFIDFTGFGLVIPLLPFWAERLGAGPREIGLLLGAGLLLLAAGLVALPWSTDLPTLLAALGVLSIGDGAVTPTLATLLSLASPEQSQGQTLGVAQGLTAVGRIIGPVLMGYLFALNAALPFLIGGALPMVGIALILFRRAHPSRRARRAAPVVARPTTAGKV